jgi:cellulose synthase/poly-beta-1,6-N-acetylglucosamine synthase-like glycosyltransferase
MTEVFIWLLILPPSAALAYFALEAALGLTPVAAGFRRNACLRFVIIVPAHNEGRIIGNTIRRLINTVDASGTVLVVADNCTDATAAVASEAGANVIERHDGSRRGKGFALAFAREHLMSAPPDVVVILDADCRTRRGGLGALAAMAVAHDAPVQCVNLLSAPAGSPPLVLLSNFAMRVKNLIRARGLFRLGRGVPLYGTGMAFPWHIFEKLDLATSEAVEDIRLSLQLAASGVRIEFSEDTEVVSPAAELKDSLGQRGRWEHGFLRLAVTYALPLLSKGVAMRSRHLIALGMHMLVPPLALLFLVGVLGAAVACMLGLLTDSWAPLAVIVSSLAAALAGIIAAWVAEGRHELTLRALALAPLYILWKVPLYLRFFTARQRGWNRTPRVSDED